MGKRIGQYVLGKQLGAGNFSTVRLAVDTNTGESWAIKIIDKDRLEKEHLHEQLKREIVILKALNHPNVVFMKEVMQTKNHIYIVLELVTGGELFGELCQARRFDEDRARKYFQQLIVGLHHCHTNGVAHRDLKLENLLLDAQGVIKINDFGLSNFQSTNEKLQTCCGTPNYVAPEVLLDAGYNGKIADIWSCGVILFAMLAGALPFQDDNLRDLYAKIEKADYRFPRHFSAEVKDLLGHILTPDPVKRWTIPQIAKHPWFSVGFDESRLLVTVTTPAMTSDAIGRAIADAGEDKPEDDKPDVVPAKVPTTVIEDPSLDAFDIISRLTAGKLNPLVADRGSIIVKSTARFLYRGSKAAILSALTSMQAHPNTKDGVDEIKGFMTFPKGTLTYVINLLPTVTPSLFIAEVHRGRGDLFDFQKMYGALQQKLGDAVRTASQASPGSPVARVS